MLQTKTDRRTHERFAVEDRRNRYKPITLVKNRPLRESDTKEVFNFFKVLKEGKFNEARAFAKLIINDNLSQGYSYLIISYSREIESILKKIHSIKENDISSKSEKDILMSEARTLFLDTDKIFREISEKQIKLTPDEKIYISCDINNEIYKLRYDFLMGKHSPSSVDAMKYAVNLIENGYPNALQLLVDAIEHSKEYNDQIHSDWSEEFNRKLNSYEFDKAIAHAKQMIAVGAKSAFSLLCKAMRRKFAQQFNNLYSDPFATKPVLEMLNDLQKWGIANNSEMWKTINLLDIPNNQINSAMWHYALDTNFGQITDLTPQFGQADTIETMTMNLLEHQQKFELIKKRATEFINTKLFWEKSPKEVVSGFKSNFIDFLTKRKLEVPNYGKYKSNLIDIFEGLIDIFGEFDLVEIDQNGQKVVNKIMAISFYSNFISTGSNLNKN